MNGEFILRIVVAAILGGAIGLERNYRAKEAGFRTHFLVALGSALLMVISQHGVSADMLSRQHISFDPLRIASQVVTGIGFIGAGTIIFQKQWIKLLLRILHQKEMYLTNSIYMTKQWKENWKKKVK